MLKILCSKLFMRRAVKVYHLRMYNGNIQQNSLCVESRVTEEFHIFPRFSLHLRLPAAAAELAVDANAPTFVTL